MRSSPRRRLFSSLLLVLACLSGVADRHWLGRATAQKAGKAGNGAASQAASPLAAAATFCNNTGITINTSGSSPTAASPYPSTINVSGLTGTVSKVTVTLTNLNHPFPDDVDILLVGPAGTQALIFSDVGGSTCANCPVTLTLDDATAGILPNSNFPTPLASGAFQPANYASAPADSFPAPTPALAQTLGSALAVFNGTNPNGTWSLYVVDDGTANVGTLDGWCLNISAGSGPCSIQPPANVTQAKDANFCGAVVNYAAPTTTGACGSVTCAPPTGAYFPLGTTVVNCAEASPGTATASFNVIVTGSCSTSQVCNNAPITITDSGGAVNAAAPYPSTINISGVAQPIGKVTVTLANFNHQFPDKVDILLVGPQGQKALLWSDVGGDRAKAISAKFPVTLTLDDQAAKALPNTSALSTGKFQPTNYNGTDADSFPTPAPTPDSNSSLAVFNGTNANGTWSLYVVSDGGAGSDVGALASGWCLNIAQANSSPTITPVGVTRQAGSTTATATIANVNDAEDAENALTVTVNGGPAATVNGVTVSNLAVSAAGVVTANVGAACGATNATFNLVVTDSQAATGNSSLTVTVTPNTPPVLSYNSQNMTAGTTPSFNPATGPSDNGTINSLVVQSIAPATGLTLSPNQVSGQLVVTSATLIGNYTVTVAATDNCGTTTTAIFMVTVVCPTLTLAPATLPNGSTSSAYNQTFAASPAGTYNYTVTTGSLPPGLSLNSATGALTGTPTAGGSFSFAITATGWGGCSKTQNYSLLITSTCATITVNPTSLPSGTLGGAYSQSISATGGSGPYTFAVTQGALPGGLSLDSATGALTGTFTQNGTFSFRITATAPGGCTGSRSYVLSVNCATLTISPATLPNGTAGVSYSQTFTVNPAGTYTFSVLLGSLPPGLSLSSAGVLSGVPGSLGTYNFTIKAQSGSCQGTKAYTLVITKAAALAQLNDYDGDGKADPALFAANGEWRIQYSAVQQAQPIFWGTAGDVPLGGDYDGDGKTDLAVFRPSNGTWYILQSGQSSDSRVLAKAWGLATDVPVPGDYDGDGKTDLAVWRGAEGNWYIWRSSDQQFEIVNWGLSLAPFYDVPVAGDYDGDGRTDIGVFRRANSIWYVRLSGSGNLLVKRWGQGTDVPVVNDYDGDGKVDLAVWRGSNGTWYIQTSADESTREIAWGAGFAPYFDQATPGDYDGDGEADLAVWRALDASWYLSLSGPATNSATRVIKLGEVGDKPVNARLP